MASITQRSTGRWQVRIRRRGLPVLAKDFLTKAAAEAWARKTESDLERRRFIDSTEAEQTTLNTVLIKYQAELIPYMKSQKQEKSKCRIVGRRLGGEKLINLTTKLLADYKAERLEEVSGKTVREELLLLQRVLNYAMKDLGIPLPNGNVASMIRKPKPGKARDRRLTRREWEVIREVPVFAFAVHTGMRRGEIAALQWRDVSLVKRWAKLRDSKNDNPRVVPLSTKAVAILETERAKVKRECGEEPSEDDSIFGMSGEYMTAKFIKLRRKWGFNDLRFHDLRHEATSRLFEKGLAVMEVASITGHKSLSMLERYTHLSQQHLLNKLDS